MRDEEQIISNIKLISFLILICSFGIIICLGINIVFLKQEKEEITEIEESYSYGEINEKEEPIINAYPKELNSEISNMVGSTYLNLMQSGKVTSNKDIVIYSKYNKAIDNYDIYILDKNTNKEEAILTNMNCSFLHIYDNYLLGIYDKTYNETLKTDCIFIYNLKKKILTVYDKNLGNITNRFITSFSTDGNRMYFTEYYTNSLFSISFNGKKVEKIADMKKTNFTGYSRIFNMENNIISFTDGYSTGYLDLNNGNIKYQDNSLFNYNNKEINIIQNIDSIDLYLDNELIYNGNILTLNYDKALYFSDNNKLFKYTENEGLELILETTFLINQIYIDNNFIILADNQNNIIFLKGDTYEIYSESNN